MPIIFGLLRKGFTSTFRPDLVIIVNTLEVYKNYDYVLY